MPARFSIWEFGDGTPRFRADVREFLSYQLVLFLNILIFIFVRLLGEINLNSPGFELSKIELMEFLLYQLVFSFDVVTFS